MNKTIFAVAFLVAAAFAAVDVDALVDEIFKTEVKPIRMCPMIYSPVCTKSGKHYSNSCIAATRGNTEELFPCGMKKIQIHKVKPMSDAEHTNWDCVRKYCKHVAVCTACMVLVPSQTSACDGHRPGKGQCCWNDAASRSTGLPRC
jgi:hypothetical protein